MSRRALLLGSLLSWLACSEEQPAPVLEPPPPGVAADPRWLTFSCVEPGCDQTLSTTVKVIGTRDLAIKRVVLDDTERTDFTVASSRTPPFVLKTTETFQVDVTFRPDGDPRLGDVDVLITFTDASASESEDRVPPGELRVPLVRRLIGEPAMAVSPDQLVFGAVLPGDRRGIPLTISNIGFGNVGLVLSSVQSDLPEVTIENLPPAAILPSESWDVSVVFAPIEEGFIEGYVTVRSADPLAPAPMIPMIGTSLPNATIGLLPEDALDFGEIAVRTSTGATIYITNRGARGLQLYAVELVNPTQTASITLDLPRRALTSSIAPLESIALGVQLTALSTPGPINSLVRITSNATGTPVLDLPVIGLVTEPNIAITPLTLDFGRVPRGWAVARPIEVENSGFGDLVITNVTMVLGSSELFGLRTVPNLPARLRHGQRIGLEVEFRSEAEATFNGTLAIDSSDPDTPFVEVAITAAGASCNEGCPIANGTPNCTTGICEIGECNLGYYDSDHDASNGCECAEVGSDPASFCAMAPFLGTLPDDNARTNFTGIIPTPEDEDFVRFFALDESQIFSEDYHVRVRLESPDPGIQFCIYRYDVGNHENACILENENCPGAARYYDRDGSLGPDDSADFTIKVFRAGGSAPTCNSYTLFISND